MREGEIAVSKMHATRNDFVVVDRRIQPIEDEVGFARWVCDRHAGVGADGLILLETSAIADVRMRILNADGSEAEMCGNGIRCAARWLDEAGEGHRRRFETLAGPVETTVERREPEYVVRVKLGIPRLDRVSLPPQTRATIVDLGNPHVVVFRDRPDDIEVARLAEGLQRDARFPNGTNVHVASWAGDAIAVRHWERGVGLTQACGTGAVAVAAAAIASDLASSPVLVDVPGGRLQVEWDGVGPAFLSGSAVRVFDTVLRGRVAVAR